MNQEPSILDFVKARIRYGIRRLLHPSEVIDKSKQSEVWLELEDVKSPGPTGSVQASRAKKAAVRPKQSWETLEAFLKSLFSRWRTLLALGLGVAAQISLEPHASGTRQWAPGLLLYLLAGAALIWANLKHEWSFQVWEEEASKPSDDRVFIKSSAAFIASLVFSLMAFITFSTLTFTWYNLILWLLALGTMFWAFWKPGTTLKSFFVSLKEFFTRSLWEFKLDPWAVLVLAAFAVAVFFRIYHLAAVPSQMVSDQAEKLLDIGDVLNGKFAVFFTRNTGREFFQFYLTAAIILLFKTGLTYMSLKIGTTLAGLVTLYYIYLLGKEIGNKRVGLLAMILAGIGYWPNVVSRFGLRLPLYPLFYAPALYYFLKGLRTRNRNCFLWSGLALGLGLNGYSPYRVVPLVILVAIGLYWLHNQSKGYRRQALWGLFALVAVSVIVFIPLFRYMLTNPEIVLYRGLTRVGTLEQPLPGPAWIIFLKNLRNSLTMMGWDDGEVWPISVPHYPALDMITSVLFHLGVVLMVIRYVRQKHWLDLFTLLSIPLLMLPSIVSLAFPGENPSMNRSAAAFIPIFLIAGLAFDGLLKFFETASLTKWNKWFAGFVGVAVLLGACFLNYDLVFNKYRDLYDRSAWNTTDLGQVVHGFVQAGGKPSNQWLVAYPYWVDSRLVMFNAGLPMQDDAIMPENLNDTVAVPGEKLFLLNVQDTSFPGDVKTLYPHGWATEFKSKFEGKNFIAFQVPPYTP